MTCRERAWLAFYLGAVLASIAVSLASFAHHDWLAGYLLGFSCWPLSRWVRA